MPDEPVIKNEDISVEEIMCKIKDNIRKRKECEDIQEDVMINDEISGEESQSECGNQRDITYINSNWNIQNTSYHISSHRPIGGKILVKGRDLVHGEVRRYVDPTIVKQKEFNASVVRILNETTRKVKEVALQKAKLNDKLIQVSSDLKNEIDGRIGQARSEIQRDIDGRIGQARSEIQRDIDGRIGQARSEIVGEIEDRIKTLVSLMNNDIENKAWLASILDKKIEASINDPRSSIGAEENLNYFVFEERFRGPREDVKAKQLSFVDFFEHNTEILDIGCGRGEFLELLREKGVKAKGIDLDEDMIFYCRSKGLDAEKIDAIAYLEKIADKSLEGIFLDQVVEHLEPDYLIRMLSLCYKKLKFGCYIIIETVNPLSFASFTNFYIDMTHKKPIHPETLKFLLESTDFREIKVKFCTPLPQEMRLRNVKAMREEEEEQVNIYNYNIELLNNILFGPQDYAVIGLK